jgi:hypothetical protein
VVKFFLVLRPYPTYGLVVLAVVVVLAVTAIELNPAELDSGLGLILFVQMFLASSGFLGTARRGHFDPMLGYGASRTGAMAAQWCASIAPGALAWAIVSTTAWVSGSEAALSALAGARLLAFFIVCAVAWAAGFVLPRGGAGALWMGVLVLLLLRHAELLTPASGAASPMAIFRTAGALILCPFLLLGPRSAVSGLALGAAAAAALTVLLGTWRAGSRLDLYLVEHS